MELAKGRWFNRDESQSRETINMRAAIADFRNAAKALVAANRSNKSYIEQLVREFENHVVIEDNACHTFSARDTVLILTGQILEASGCHLKHDDNEISKAAGNFLNAVKQITDHMEKPDFMKHINRSWLRQNLNIGTQP